MTHQLFSIRIQLQKLLYCILLTLCFNSIKAQTPNCKFNDTEGYFYNWAFDAENIEFKLKLENQTPLSDKNEITGYKIEWGDKTEETVTNADFPLYHTYSEKKIYNMKITTHYKGADYTSTYIVYNTKPTVKAEIIEGENGCAGQKYTFKLVEYENNPPKTKYYWSFGDGAPKIIWTHEQLIDNKGTIEHIFNKTSCISVNNGEHYDAGAEPVLRIDGNMLVGVGTKAGPIIISKEKTLNIEL